MIPRWNGKSPRDRFVTAVVQLTMMHAAYWNGELVENLWTNARCWAKRKIGSARRIDDHTQRMAERRRIADDL
jgi:hypothetical protein